MLKASMECSSWPLTTGWDCLGGGIWTELDTSMNILQTSECESLCYKRNTNGCCMLNGTSLDRIRGCYWRDFATANNLGGNTSPSTNTSTNTSIAISCNFTGISFKSTDLD